jgi:hypothetical protein
MLEQRVGAGDTAAERKREHRSYGHARAGSAAVRKRERSSLIADQRPQLALCAAARPYSGEPGLGGDEQRSAGLGGYEQRSVELAGKSKQVFCNCAVEPGRGAAACFTEPTPCDNANSSLWAAARPYFAEAQYLVGNEPWSVGLGGYEQRSVELVGKSK